MGDLLLEGSIALSEHHADPFSIICGGGEIQVSVAVEVSRRHVVWFKTGWLRSVAKQETVLPCCAADRHTFQCGAAGEVQKVEGSRGNLGLRPKRVEGRGERVLRRHDRLGKGKRRRGLAGDRHRSRR